MRTTLTLDDDLAQALHAEARRSGASFKAVVNAAIRSGLSRGEKPESAGPRFKVEPQACGFRAGIDPQKLNQLVDELEIEDFNREIDPALEQR